MAVSEWTAPVSVATRWVPGGRVRGTRAEAALWIVAVTTMVLDVALTYYGLRNGLVESNPVTRRGLREFGLIVLPVLKAFALAVGVLGRSVLPTWARPVVPFALSLPWTVAVLVNFTLVLGHV